MGGVIGGPRLYEIAGARFGDGMRSVHLDLAALDRIDVASVGLPVARIPRRQVARGAAQAALNGAINLMASTLSPWTGLQSLLSLQRDPVNLTLVRPTRIGIGARTTRAELVANEQLIDITALVGIPRTEFAFAGLPVRSTICASTSPELASVVCSQFGWWNLGGSKEDVATFSVCLGPAEDCEAVAWGVGAEVHASGTVRSDAAMLLFTDRPYRFVGVAFQIRDQFSAFDSLSILVNCDARQLTVRVRFEKTPI